MRVSALLAAAGAFTAKVVSAATAPGLTYLYSANSSIATPIVYGATPKGTRIAIPLTGGTFSGPKLNGTILSFGADWGVTDTFGVYNPDTRYGLMTDDGVPIYVQTTGPSKSDGAIHQRIVFEVSRNSSYAWLNEIVAVGIVHAFDTYITVDAWQLETPVAAC